MLKLDDSLKLGGACKERTVGRGYPSSVPNLLKDRIIHVGCSLELSVRRRSGGDAEIAVRGISRSNAESKTLSPNPDPLSSR